MADHDHNQSLPPEEDARIAGEVFQRGEIEHALFHLSFSLAHDPEQPAWLALLDHILDAAQNSPDVMKPDASGGMHYSHAAVLAYILARRSEYDSAVNLLINVHNAIPQPVYLPWLTRWLSQPAAVAKIDVQTLTALVGGVSSRIPRNSGDNPALWQNLENFLPSLDMVLKQFSNEGFLCGITSTVFRKLGQHQRALEIAERAYRVQPGDMTAIFLAGAYRAVGDVEKTLATYEKALQHNPGRFHVKLDAGDLLVDEGRIKEGLRYYEDVLKVERQQPWAYPSALYYRFVLDENPKWEKELQAYARANPDNDRAAYMLHLFEMFRIHKEPYRLYLPEPTEATLNILRQLMQTAPEKLKKPGSSDNKVTMSLSSLEAPSSRLALETYLREIGDVRLELTATVPTPDPRKPIIIGRYLLWKYDGTTPAPSVPPPDKNIAEHVAVLASRPFNIDDWKAQAGKIATRLGPQSIPDLMAVMVHPPERPRNLPIWNWIQQIQVAAALIIAYTEIGWSGSNRRNALFSLALGPMDWTTTAGIIVLTELALEDASIRAEVIKVFQRIIDNRPDEGAVCYELALAHCGLMLPDLPKAMRDHLENMKGWLS